VSSAVLDASALLALLNEEPGQEEVERVLISGAVVSAVNFSEVVARLADAGMPEAALREALEGLELNVVAFDRELAYRAGLLRGATREHGLSLGDRACLALAASNRCPAITADRAWESLDVGVAVRLIR
jgi:PIN domain nuclease of toxin-antitoxin system